MSYYVPIKAVNGRKDLYDLALRLDESIYGTVEYNNGGWHDYEIGVVLPHLKFERDEDAIAFALVSGSMVYKKIPCKNDIDSRKE